MSILRTSDFNTGEYAIASNLYTQLDSYIIKYEREYLLRLLGSELYDLFIANLTGTTPQVPQAVIYLSIFNEFHREINGINVNCEGMKEMLKQFIYFHFMRESVYKKSTFGITTEQAENATNNIYQGFNLIQAYNKGVSNAFAIQIFIEEKQTDYPKYLGDFFQFQSGI